jgi:hypothetical protein
MKTHIILLRGAMPTGKSKGLMAPLRAALEELGLKGVQMRALSIWLRLSTIRWLRMAQKR